MVTSLYFSVNDPISMKFGKQICNMLPRIDTRQKDQFFYKLKIAAGYHIEIVFGYISAPKFGTRNYRITQTHRPCDQKSANFENSRWRMAAIWKVVYVYVHYASHVYSLVHELTVFDTNRCRLLYHV